MIKLYDKQIREVLIHRLANQVVKPNAIIEELHVHNGNAIADVVALYSEAHCFEIKSDVDNINRILKQGIYYDLSFRKITLVTTNKHLKKALDITPKHWGIMIASAINNEVSLKYIRAAKHNKNFNKEIALKALWKDEMISLGYEKSKNIRRDELVKIISKDYKKQEISKNISLILQNRFSKKQLYTI